MKKLLLASTATLFGETYLQYLKTDLTHFFKGCATITFIPYARPGGLSHDAYTAIVQKAFMDLGKEVRGLHTYTDQERGIGEAEAIFVGGGNTFVLLHELLRTGIMPHIKQKVLDGTPYMGSSAGSNIAGPSIKTTNDMPIVHPSSFEALGLVEFNLNPHYQDPDPNSTHNGETRETRIREFHCFNNTPVVGLREGNYLWIENGSTKLLGKGTARIFEAGKPPYEASQIPF
ncbi:MAG: dipeptidase PepE [Sediminicola sp.]|tara:strand:- start:67055 stop:67747 length:693 start_codon:yes stop_codon:yes gene_type:complete